MDAVLPPIPKVGYSVRVATYTQPSAPSRGSLAGLCLLVLTILLGTGVLPTVISHFAGSYDREITYVWLLIYCLSLFGLMFNHGINWISWLVRYRILLVILLIGTIVSVSWSVDARVSTERTIHLVGSSLVAIYIGFTVPLLTTLRVFAVVLGLVMLASVGAAIGLVELGIENYEGSQVWRGVFNSKNDLGFWAACGVLLYVTLSDSTVSTGRRLLCFLLAGLCLALLGLSQSATSLLALLIAGSLSLYLFIAIRFQLGFIRMVVMAVLFTALLALAVANIDTAELVGRTDDLTGRGEVWRQTWKLIMDRPLTGYGYGSIWFPNDATIWIQQSLTDFTWVVFHAHNGFLQVASEVGLPLSVIALLMVAQQLIEIFYCQYERQQVGVLFVLAFVVAFLISNFSEARFLVTRELFWIFFLALPISMLRQINLISVTPDDGPEPDTGGYSPGNPDGYPGGFQTGYSGAHPGKPWLQPGMAQTGAALSAASAASASEHQPPDRRPPERRPPVTVAHEADSQSTGAGWQNHLSQSVQALPHTDAADDFATDGHEHEDWTGGFVDETFDVTAGTLSLTDTDIDLGDLDQALATPSASASTTVNSDQGIASADTHRWHAANSPIDGLDRTDDLDDVMRVGQRADAAADDRYDKSIAQSLDDLDASLDDSGEWIDISLGDGSGGR